MRRLLFALLLASSAAAAQVVGGAITSPQQPQGQNPFDQTQQQPATAIVAGKVIDADSGKGLKKAVVTLRRTDKPDSRPQATSTNEEGAFEFKDIAAGKYTIIASRRGYARPQRGAGAGQLTVNAGQKIDDQLLKLVVGSVLTGRAVDEDGEPLTGVQVQALRSYYNQNGKKQLTPAGFASTDDRGEYRLFGLAPGTYTIRATYTGFNMFSGGGVGLDGGENLAYPSVYYPNVTEPAQAAPLTFRRGDEQRADFSFQPTHSFTVKGKVLMPAGSSGSRPYLMLLPSDPEAQMTFNYGRNAASATADDSFEFLKVLPGSYVLVARGSADGKQLIGTTKVEVQSDVENVIVGVAPGAEMGGKIIFEGDVKPTRGMRVSLQSEQAIPFGGVGFAGAPVKEDQSFTISDIVEGTYRVSIFGLPPDAYIKSVRFGSEDVTNKGLQLGAARKLPPLEIVASTKSAKVTGLISNKDDKPQQGVSVVLVPDDQPKALTNAFKVTTTDQTGHYLLQGVRPGHYKLYVFDGMEPGAFQDPDFLRRYSDSAKSVNLSEGSQETVDTKSVDVGSGDEG